MPLREEQGELQLTEYGISGIPVFQISGEALRLKDEGHDVTVNVDYAPEYDYKELIDELTERFSQLNRKPLSKFLYGMFNNKMADYLYTNCNINNSNKEFDEKSICESIANSIKNNLYTVKGHRGFDNCQVCTGGVLVSDLKPTLESKLVPGLYFAGEIIDVNGDCGGYNLQWAWSSGYVAGLLK